MIIGIGCDVVDHKVTNDLGWSTNPNRLRRIFSQKELEQYQVQKTDKFISGRFAAKEAVLKCLGIGMRDGIALTDIQVLQNDAGKPVMEIAGEVKNLAEQMGIISLHVSISHTDHISIAFVVAEG